MTADAVYVTLVPVQTDAPGSAVIPTLTASGGPTSIVMVLEVAGLPVRQGAAFEVMIQIS